LEGLKVNRSLEACQLIESRLNPRWLASDKHPSRCFADAQKPMGNAARDEDARARAKFVEYAADVKKIFALQYVKGLIFSMVDVERHPAVWRHGLLKNDEVSLGLMAGDETCELRVWKLPGGSGPRLVALQDRKLPKRFGVRSCHDENPTTQPPVPAIGARALLPSRFASPGMLKPWSLSPMRSSSANASAAVSNERTRMAVSRRSGLSV